LHFAFHLPAKNKTFIMKTIVIVGGVVLAGATLIGFMMNERKKEGQPSFSSQGFSQTPGDSLNKGGNSAAGNAGLNPAHGKPGHRCDLAVGAPLTGNPGTQTLSTAPVSTVPTSTVPVTTTTTAVSQQAAPAGQTLNPAHGQPGHRCDISVGAPLNSPAKSGAINTQSQAITTKAAPATQPAPAGLKINPAHGQPGHRCELAVGAPLTGATSSKLTTDSIK
jgi:hypothetical protein